MESAYRCTSDHWLYLHAGAHPPHPPAKWLPSNPALLRQVFGGRRAIASRLLALRNSRQLKGQARLDASRTREDGLPVPACEPSNVRVLPRCTERVAARSKRRTTTRS